jgi:hypothetical protein
MSADSAHPATGCDAPSDELAGIVIAAGRRGFPRWRVATALGISRHGLARIEQGDFSDGTRQGDARPASGTTSDAGGG